MSTRPARTVLLGGPLVVALAVATATAGTAVTHAGAPPLPEGGINEQQLRLSVTVFDGPAHVQWFSAADFVTSLGDDVSTEDGQTTISLSTDLLFAENSWDLPPAAPGRIAELVSDVPDGATVTVTGHTDTQQPIGHDFDNQELSERRAAAVAEALRGERPDLELEVSGVGDTAPAVAPDPQDPATHAANRRVEVGYAG